MHAVLFYSLHFLGLILFIAGVLGVSFLEPFIHQQIKDRFNLATPQTEFYTESFVNQSENVDVFKVFYFFNITNLDDVKAGTAYPHVDEYGPYYYQRVRVHTQADISWKPAGTIQYRWSERTVFRPDLSNGTEEDVIFTARLGPIFAHQETSASNFNPIALEVYRSKAPDVKTVFVNKTVKELVYGYKDPFLDSIFETDPAKTGVSPDLYNVSYSEVYTGGKASKTQPAPPERAFGKFTMWKGLRDLSTIWTTNETQKLVGTDGTTFSPFLDDVTELTAFVEALQRPVILQHRRDEEVDGLPTRIYHPRSDQFNDGTVTPFNKGFRIFQQGFQPRPPVQNIADGDIVGAISKLHFLDCAGPYLNTTGIRAASRKLDETHLQFETNTATVIQVRKRSMLNVLLKPYQYKDIYDFPHTLGESGNLASHQTWLPYVAETEEVDLPMKLKKKLKNEVILPLKIAKPVGAVLIGLGLIVVVVVFFVDRRQKKNGQESGSDTARRGDDRYQPSEREVNNDYGTY